MFVYIATETIYNSIEYGAKCIKFQVFYLVVDLFEKKKLFRLRAFWFNIFCDRHINQSSKSFHNFPKDAANSFAGIDIESSLRREAIRMI